MRIALFGSRHQSYHLDNIVRLLDNLSERGAYILMEERFYNYLLTLLPVVNVDDVLSENVFQADYVISIGGDGTFLRTATQVGSLQIPIAGINTGHLGYLADFSFENIDKFVDELFGGNLPIDQRSLLEVSANGNVSLPKRFALNDVAIQKSSSASMLHMRTRINGKELTTYLGDGLIISTPTGSTAYNLSVGGPIIHPACSCLVVSPIAAHSLTMRPLVVSDELAIEITTESKRSETFRISIDGKSVAVPMGTTLHLKKADFKVHIVQNAAHDFASTLRSKLMWGADSR